MWGMLRGAFLISSALALLSAGCDGCQPPAGAAAPDSGGERRLIKAKLEAFCSQWDTPTWMVSGPRNPFYRRIMSKVRQRGEQPPPRLCRRVWLQQVLTSTRAVAVGFAAEFVDPRLPGQWVPKPNYCVVMDRLQGYGIVYWNNKPAMGCHGAGGYFKRLDNSAGLRGDALCEPLYRPMERWLLAGGTGDGESCLGRK